MEGNRGKNKKVVCEKEVENKNTKEKEANMKKMKLAYTNIDGFISSKLELEDYL